jgi:hypothetical protein
VENSALKHQEIESPHPPSTMMTVSHLQWWQVGNLAGTG